MIEKIPTLQKLIKNLQQVPYLASKNLYRVATHFLAMDAQKMEQLCQTLRETKKHLAQCGICFMWKETAENCCLCGDSRRNPRIVCVVESWQEVLVIEKTGGYQGMYHILGGAICPLDGIGPEDLTIEHLLGRVVDHQVEEVILATNQTPEGEATAAFIASKIKQHGIAISCLARGIPIGSSLEFMDRLTIYKAMSERRPF